MILGHTSRYLSTHNNTNVYNVKQKIERGCPPFLYPYPYKKKKRLLYRKAKVSVKLT